MTLQELTRKKADIDEAVLKLASIEGEEKSILSQLKELGCATIKSAVKESEVLSTEIDKMEASLEPEYALLDEFLELNEV